MGFLQGNDERWPEQHGVINGGRAAGHPHIGCWHRNDAEVSSGFPNSSSSSSADMAKEQQQ